MANMYWRWIDIRDGRSANTLRMLGSIEHEIGDITSFAWSDHENLIAIATYDNKIYLFDPLANEIIREFDTDMRIHLGLWRGNYLYTVRDYFSSNVDELVDYQYASQVWDVNSGQRVSSFAIGRYDSVGCRRYSPNGRWLMATRPGSIVQIWDTFTGTVVQSQQFEISACPVWNPDSSSLALANHAGDLQIVNLPLTGERFPFPSADIVFFAVNSDIGTALRVAKLSEAPVDTTVDYIGYYSLGVGGLSYGTEPPYYEVSPDYRRWLYARQDEAGHYNIFEDRISYGGELLPIVRGGWNLYPTYSPAEFSDDAEIAYLHSDDETHFDLLVLGTDRETSQPVLADRQPYLEAPAWVPSPDHRQLTIALQTAMGDYDIYLLDLNEQTLDPIIQHAANDHSPAWSPDGSKLLFVSDRNQEESIFLFDRATESTQFVVIGNHPDWSPDGTRIVFTHDEAVYVTDILGEDIQLFIEGAFSPHWMLIAY